MAAVTEDNKNILARLTVEISNQLTADQKNIFKDKSDKYIQTFSELAENR